MLKNIFLLFFISFTTRFFAQYQITGNVLSQEANKPLKFATIQISNNAKQFVDYTTTDSNGLYSLEITKAGRYFFEISFIGYVKETYEINITEKITQKDFILKKDVTELKEIVLKFDPKVMKVANDTITYNLKKLTDGSEKTLKNILDKLPGVRLNSSGQIIVNGKTVKKLLIDGEELFKNQHRNTTENVTADMVKGIRYLNKYQDFGNITGFNNKESNALDVSIKDEYKNKITGNFSIQTGYNLKHSFKTNLFRFGGKLKFGFIGDWNSIGKQSITANEYNQLRAISFDGLDKNGFKVNRFNNDSPKFLEPTNNIAERTNIFGALSLIYKPSKKTKISFLNISSNTTQKQRIANSRIFFNNVNLNQIEQKKMGSQFFLNNSILEFGYQPNNTSFFEYTLNYNPQHSDEDTDINNQFSGTTNTLFQNQQVDQYSLDQQISYFKKVTHKTLLKSTGFFSTELIKSKLNVSGNTPVFILNSVAPNTSIFQKQILKKNSIGYQLESISKFKKHKLGFSQGIVATNSSFKNQAVQLEDFNFTTHRIDSYLNATLKSKLHYKLRTSTSIGYKYVNLNRFETSFDNYLFTPALEIDYLISNHKSLGFEYKYDIDLPKNDKVTPKKYFQNYLNIKQPSTVKNNQLLPKHSFNLYFSNFNSKTGSNISTNLGYKYAPNFITLNTIVDNAGTANNFAITGTNQQQINAGLFLDKKMKIKIGILSNSIFYSLRERNEIGSSSNKTSIEYFKQKLGIYSRYIKGINFDLGLEFEQNTFEVSLFNSITKSTTTKPYLILNGTILDKKITWNIATEYAIYKTELAKTKFFRLNPLLTYSIKENLELSLEGNNIFNINNAQITLNSNTINYFENQTIDTLEGYLVLGLTYKL